MTSSVAAASSHTGMSEVPAQQITTGPRVGRSIRPRRSVRETGSYVDPFTARRTGPAFSGASRVTRSGPFRASFRAMAAICAPVFPSAKITSGIPTRSVRCTSSVARSPSRSYGAPFRRRTASSRGVFPARTAARSRRRVVSSIPALYRTRRCERSLAIRSGSGMTRMSPSRAAPVPAAAAEKRVASATDPAWATSCSTQWRPLPRAKRGTERRSVSLTRAATAETNALPTMFPDSRRALSATPRQRPEGGWPRRAARVSASPSGRARRRSPVSGPSSFTPTATRSWPSAPRKAAIAPGPVPTHASGTSISKRRFASFPSAVRAWPQPMEATSWSASTSREAKPAFMRRGPRPFALSPSTSPALSIAPVQPARSRRAQGRRSRRGGDSCGEEPLHVEDEHREAGAEHRHGRQADHAVERLAERLQHRLLLADEGVHGEADPPLGALRDDDRSIVARDAREAEKPLEAVHRHELAVVGEDGRAPAPVEPRHLHLRGAVHLRDGEPDHLARDAHEQDGLHRHGEREAERDARARAGSAVDLDRPAHRLDRALHRVEPDAAAGDVRHELGGGDARQAGEEQGLAVAQGVRLLLADRAACHRRAAELRRIHPLPVVAHLQDDPVPLAARVDRHAARGGLAGEEPQGRRL